MKICVLGFLVLGICYCCSAESVSVGRFLVKAGWKVTGDLGELQSLSVDFDWQCSEQCNAHQNCTSFKFNQNETKCILHERKANFMRNEIVQTTDLQMNYGEALHRISPDLLSEQPRGLPNETHIIILGGDDGVNIRDEIIEIVPEKTLVQIVSKLTTPRKHFQAALWNSNHKIIIDGGTTSTGIVDSLEFLTVEHLDHYSGGRSKTPRFRSGGCSFIHQNKYYSCLGQDNTGDYMKFCDRFTMNSQDQLAFTHEQVDIQYMFWGNVDSACVLYDDDLWILGGRRKNLSPIDDLRMLSLTDVTPPMFSLTFIAPPYDSLYASSVVMDHKNELMVCGGIINGTTEYTDKCLYWRPTKNTWHYLPSMNIPRAYFMLVNWRDKYMAIGGKTTGDVILDSIEVLESGSWRLSNLVLPQPLFGMQALNLDHDYLQNNP